MKKGEEEDKEKLESVKDAGKKEKTSKKKAGWLEQGATSRMQQEMKKIQEMGEAVMISFKPSNRNFS